MTSHSDVCYNWANKTGKGKRGHHVFYEGETIYSYGHHFPIARHTKTLTDDECIFVTTQSYSSSTAAHTGLARHAIPSGLKVFNVHSVICRNKQDHRKNHTAMVRNLGETLDKATRARSNKPRLLQKAEALRKAANDYSVAFKLNRKPITE